MPERKRPEFKLVGGRRIFFALDHVVSEDPAGKGTHVHVNGVDYVLEHPYDEVLDTLGYVEKPAVEESTGTKIAE